MAIGAEEDDEAVFVGHPAVCSAEETMVEGGVSLPFAEVAQTGAGLEDGFYLAFSRLHLVAYSHRNPQCVARFFLQHMETHEG